MYSAESSWQNCHVSKAMIYSSWTKYLSQLKEFWKVVEKLLFITITFICVSLYLPTYLISPLSPVLHT